MKQEEVLNHQKEAPLSDEMSRLMYYYLRLPNDEVLRLYRRCREEQATPEESSRFGNWIWSHALRRARTHRDLPEEEQRERASLAAWSVWKAWVIEKMDWVQVKNIAASDDVSRSQTFEEVGEPHVRQLVAFVNKVTNNEVLNYFRQRKRPVLSLDSQEDGETLADMLPDAHQNLEDVAVANLQRKEMNRLLRQAMRQLSPAEREVMRLYLKGLQPYEIAPLLGKKQGTVRELLRKARERIAKFLRDAGVLE